MRLLRAIHVLRPAALLVFLAVDAHALGLGDITVTSHLGQPLRARIPLTLEVREAVRDDCVTVRAEGDPTEFLSRVESGRRALRVTSTAPVFEPVLQLAVSVKCPDSGHIARGYTILLDPPVDTAPTPEGVVAPEAGPATVSAKGGTAPSADIGGFAWRVRPGDTLNTIVWGMYPHDKAMRARLARAVLDANPELAGLSRRDPLPEGATLRIPDLRTVARHGGEIAPAPTDRAARRPMPPAVLPAPDAVPEAKVAAPATAARPAPIKRPPPTPAAPAPSSEAQLKLTTGAHGGPGASLERRLQTQADNQTAELLALNNRIRQLEGQFGQLRRQLEAIAAAPGTPPPTLKPATVAPAPAPRVAAAVPARSAFSFPWLTVVFAATGVLLLIAALWWMRRRRAQTVAALAPAVVMQMGPGTKSRPSFGGRRDDLPVAPHTVPPAFSGDLDFAASTPTSLLPENAPSVSEPPARVQVSEELVESLNREVKDKPHDPQAWLALLRAYHQKREARDFLGRAVKFRVRFDDPEMWREIQAMGRELDPENALYVADGPP